MAGTMKDYLDSGTAEYTTTTLSVHPQKVLVEAPVTRQDVLFADDGEPLIIARGTNNLHFIVTLQWNDISESDAQTLVDFYLDSNKANRKMNSFYWLHPKDGNTYVARFLDDVVKAVKDKSYGTSAKVRLLVTAYKV